MQQIADYLPAMTGVRKRAFQLDQPFEALAARFAHEPGSVVLLSGSDLDCARYHILALRPWLTLRGRRKETTIDVDGTVHPTLQPPLDVLDTVLKHCRLTVGDGSDPVAAGLFGYLAYDLKDDLEALPRTAVDDLQLPHLCLFAPSLIVVHDKAAGTTVVHAPVRQDRDIASVEAAINGFLEELKADGQRSRRLFRRWSGAIVQFFTCRVRGRGAAHPRLHRRRRRLSGESFPAL